MPNSHSIRLMAASAIITTLLLGCAEQAKQNESAAQKSTPAPAKTVAEEETPEQVLMIGRMAKAPAGVMMTDMRLREAESRETWQSIEASRIQLVSDTPVSTFSIDVDTGGYSNVRRLLQAGTIPDKDRVRSEEVINYFSYDYPAPESIDKPFRITTDLTPTPWSANTQLLRIAIKGYQEAVEKLPASNLVFLVDVSGSMDEPNKLPLVKQSLKLLVNNLRDNDHVAMVTYAGGTKVVLPSTSGKDKITISNAIDQLNAGGSTAGESGLKLAYAEARKGFIQNGNNRIIMMTDGDFNVGLSGVQEMVKVVENNRDSGIYLSTAGFGQGNYREDMMEQMADHGNGAYFYIDNYQEAYRTFERNLRSNLFAIAKDVKIQVEFNPKWVKEYRLIGYENRALKREDFNNDKVDAGDVGQGHSVTALYEVTLQGSPGQVDPLRYASENNPKNDTSKYGDELAFVKLRYKPIGQEQSRLIQQAVSNKVTPFKKVDVNFQTAVAAAAFSETLRRSPYLSQDFDAEKLIAGMDTRHFSAPEEVYELRDLIRLAKSLM